MLYDATTKQGGDFGSLSCAAPGHDIPQLLYYNFTTKSREPTDVASTDALYQAMSRRRGTPKRHATVFASSDAIGTFTTKLRTRQNVVERGRAIHDVPALIARKFIKAEAILRDPSIFTKQVTTRGKVSYWKAHKSKLLRGWGHKKMTKRVLAYLQAPTTAEAQVFSRQWDTLKETMQKMAHSHTRAASPLSQRMLGAVDGDENLWKAQKAIEEADYQIQWARGYGDRPSGSTFHASAASGQGLSAAVVTAVPVIPEPKEGKGTERVPGVIPPAMIPPTGGALNMLEEFPLVAAEDAAALTIARTRAERAARSWGEVTSLGPTVPSPLLVPGSSSSSSSTPPSAVVSAHR